MGISGRSLGSCPPLLHGLALVKVAAARANGDTGALDPVLAEALVEAARSIGRGEIEATAFPADPLAGGGSIAVHMNVNEVLAALAGDALGRPHEGADAVDPKAHASASQSTADVSHTAARLAVLDRATVLVMTTDRVVATLHDVADRFDSVTTLARTCPQDALAVPLSTIFRGAAEAISRHSAAMVDTLSSLHDVVIGTTVIGRADHAAAAYRSAVVDHLAFETGRPRRAHPNPASALQHGDDLVAVSAAVTQLTYPLLKLAADLRLLGSGPAGGFGEIVMGPVLDGSSFFANKRNPVVAETMMQACRQVRGLDHTVQLVAGRAELYLQVFDGLVTVDLLDEIKLLTQAIDRLDRFARHDLQADVERCAQLAAVVTTP